MTGYSYLNGVLLLNRYLCKQISDRAPPPLGAAPLATTEKRVACPRYSPKALGMTTRPACPRPWGFPQAAGVDAERSESKTTSRWHVLTPMRALLTASLSYALVPNRPLQEFGSKRRAIRCARESLLRVRHSMAWKISKQ